MLSHICGLSSTEALGWQVGLVTNSKCQYVRKPIAYAFDELQKRQQSIMLYITPFNKVQNLGLSIKIYKYKL